MAATTSIDQACRVLRLPSTRRQFADLAEGAARDRMPTFKAVIVQTSTDYCRPAQPDAQAEQPQADLAGCHTGGATDAEPATRVRL